MSHGPEWACVLLQSLSFIERQPCICLYTVILGSSYTVTIELSGYITDCMATKPEIFTIKPFKDQSLLVSAYCIFIPPCFQVTRNVT